MSDVPDVTAPATDPVAENLRLARVKAGFGSIAEFAAAAGVPTSTYYCHEKGRRKMTRAHAELYAAALGVSWEELLYGTGHNFRNTRRIGVLGWVGDDGEIAVHGIKKITRERDPEEDENDPTLEGIPIMTDNLYPAFERGDVIYYKRLETQGTRFLRDLNGHSCIVRLKDGTHLLRKVRISKTGMVALASIVPLPNDVPLADPEIDAVSPILSVRKPVPKRLRDDD